MDDRSTESRADAGPLVLVCGDREWRDRDRIRARLRELVPGARVIAGACRGADRIAAQEARALGLPVEEFPANWARYGHDAGPRRNRAMLDRGPDLVIAFHGDLSRSRGTAHCLGEARRRGISTELIS